MNKKIMNIFKASAAIVVLCLLSVLILNTSADAVGVKKGLTVSPIRFETNINPGETKTNKIKISNFTEDAIKVDLNAELFSVINPQYDYEFKEKSKIADWIRFSNNFINLKVGETKTVSYSINVPNSAEPGGYYLSIFSSTNATSDESLVKSKQRVASLLYLTVFGDITKTGKLVSLKTPWLVDEKSMWYMLVQNTGSTHFRSDIKIKLIDYFGNEVDSISGGKPLILPGTVREVSGLLPIPKIPGLYKLNFEVGLGESQQKNNTRYVFYAPIWFILLVIIILSLIVGYIILRIKKRS